MIKRTFFPIALVLAIAALVTHLIARDCLMQSMHRKAERISQAMKQHTPYVPDPAAARFNRAWDVLTEVGVALTGASVICMLIALIRHEPGPYLILGLILAFAIALPMLL